MRNPLFVSVLTAAYILFVADVAGSAVVFGTTTTVVESNWLAYASPSLFFFGTVMFILGMPIFIYNAMRDEIPNWITTPMIAALCFFITVRCYIVAKLLWYILS